MDGIVFNPKNCFCNGNCRANLAIELDRKQDTEKAYIEARRAVLKAPNCPYTHGVLGHIMNGMNAKYAEKHLHISKSLGDHSEVADTQLGYCFIAQGKMKAAEQAFISAMFNNPNHMPAVAGLAKVAEINHDYDRAMQFCDTAFSTNPNIPFLRQTYAKVLMHFSEDNKALEILTGHDPNLLYERGKLYEKLEQYDLAFADYSAANAATNKTYNDGDALMRIANHKTFTTIQQMGRLPRLQTPLFHPITPLFITGFPRSGTTLLETMLSSHTDISAGDELKFMQEIAGFSQQWLGSERIYPFCLNELSIGDKDAVARAMRAYYITKTLDIPKDTAKYITDKMPLNEMHLPLISILFPEAPILYIRRHPLDIVMSNFSTYLTHGFNQSFNLVNSATHYSRVDGLLQHYKNKVAMVFHEFKYENLVATPEIVMKEIIDICTLPWQEEVLFPEANVNHPRTPSYQAVKEPINDKSIGRWKKFERYLGEAMRIVEPIMVREGY